MSCVAQSTKRAHTYRYSFAALCAAAAVSVATVFSGLQTFLWVHIPALFLGAVFGTSVSLALSSRYGMVCGDGRSYSWMQHVELVGVCRAAELLSLLRVLHHCTLQRLDHLI